MFILQSIAIIFALFMMYVVRIHRRKEHLEAFEYGGWLALWGGFIFCTLFPQTINGIAEGLHIASVFDLLVIVAFMILSLLTFLNRIDNKKLEKKFEDLVRKRALNGKK